MNCLLNSHFPFLPQSLRPSPIPFLRLLLVEISRSKKTTCLISEKCYFLFVILLYLVSLPLFHIFPFSFPISYFYLQKRMLAWEREILSSVRSSFRCKAVIRSHWQIQEKDPGFDLLLCTIVMYSRVSSSSFRKSIFFPGFHLLLFIKVMFSIVSSSSLHKSNVFQGFIFFFA